MLKREEPGKTDWKNLLYTKIIARNEKETYPYLPIYSHYHLLWKKTLKLDHEREIAQHIVHLMENENTEFLTKKEYLTALENVKQKIDYLYQHLQPVLIETSSRNRSDASSITSIDVSKNLSNMILEQKRLINYQFDELKMAKEELQRSMDHRVELEKTLTQIRQEYEQKIQTIQLEAQQQLDRDQTVESLRRENQFLTERLKDEKDKAAKQLNEMNLFLEGNIKMLKLLTANFFFFIYLSLIELGLRSKHSN